MMKCKEKIATAGILCTLFVAALMLPTAMAKKVYSPIVKQGEIELEYTLDYTMDNDASKNTSARHQFEIEAGITDRWSSALYGDFRKYPNQNFTYQGLKWENIYQLFDKNAYWLDAGAYVEYILASDASKKNDAIEVKVLLEKELESITHTANLLFKRELGGSANNTTKVGYAWRSRLRLENHYKIAIEAYGSWGDIGAIQSLAQQSHQIGPVIFGKFGHGMEYQLGYLFGLTQGSDDGAIKLVLGYEF